MDQEDIFPGAEHVWSEEEAAERARAQAQPMSRHPWRAVLDGYLEQQRSLLDSLVGQQVTVTLVTGEQVPARVVADAIELAEGDAGLPVLWPDPRSPAERVLAEVLEELGRQDAKWGEQNHPDGWWHPSDSDAVVEATEEARFAALEGKLTWRQVLEEEWREACDELPAKGSAGHEPGKLRAELVQVAAVAVQWVLSMDRRHQ